jgi:hypothetical protein
VGADSVEAVNFGLVKTKVATLALLRPEIDKSTLAAEFS